MIALISSDKEQLYLLQMARLIDGLAMFDAILIVPMLQIVWTFFSIFTGFIYFEEYKVCTMSLTVIDVDEMFMILPPNNNNVTIIQDMRFCCYWCF